MEEAETLCSRVAIMHLGRLCVVGEPAELEASLGEGRTLDDVFIHFAGATLDTGGSYAETARGRRTAKRLG